MGKVDYRGEPPGKPQRWMTRTEFGIVLAGATMLTAILAGAGYFYFISLRFPP